MTGQNLGLRCCLAISFTARLDPPESLEAVEFMVFRQSRGLSDHSCAGLVPAMATVLGAGFRMTVFHLTETGAGVRQKRCLVGLQRQTPVAALRVDRRNRQGDCSGAHRRSRPCP